MRRTLTLTAAASVSALVAAFAPATPSAAPADPAALTFEPEGTYEDDMDCLQLTGPPASSATGVTAGVTGADPINLHIRLLLDVVEGRDLDATTDDPETEDVDERQQAIDEFGATIVEEFLAFGEAAYADIGVTLDYASFDLLQTPDLTDPSIERDPQMDGTVAIEAGKTQYQGARPEGVDIVLVLTDRDLTSNGDSGLAGRADCIGGVASDAHAFATSELLREPRNNIIGSYREYTANVAAHEVGHLMGAHHHYQACGPYVVESAQAGAPLGACSLMTNFINFVSGPFSPTNMLVVRGHAEDFASENDPAEAHAGHDH